MALVLSAVPAGRATAAWPAFSDKAVEASIAKGIKYLWSQQKPDGSWPGKKHPHGDHAVGHTSVAAYALLDSGVGIQNPKMAKALDWLRKHDTDRVYSLGLRCNVWLSAERQAPGKFLRPLMHDAQRLISSHYQGGYHYKLSDRFSHNSSAQYGVLGVWAYKRAGREVPIGYWRVVMDYWLKGQQSDGGWGYEVKFLRPQGKKHNRPTTHAAMVPAGLASLFICFDNLHAARFVNCTGGELPKPIQQGLTWFDKNFMKSLTDPNFPIGWSSQYNYYLYGVERVGLAAGYKYFGKVNWYKEGARHIMARQGGAGEWSNPGSGTVAPTAFAVLFLIRGRHPVVFNKLEFQGDWNNRPRDMAFLTRWMSRTYERSLNWQIVNTNVDVSEWHDAPILYISGAKKPEFSARDLAKLRSYVNQGGTIFSATECGGRPFADGIREVYRKLFGRYELVPIGKDHPLRSKKVHYDLSGAARLQVISNGIRPLVVHTDVDLPQTWQLQNTATGKYAFQAATNVFMYVTDKGKLPHRGTTHWPKGISTAGMPTIKVAYIKHNGNSNPEPLAYERFSRLMAERCKVKVDMTQPIPAQSLPGSGAKLAILSGTGEFKLSADAVKALKEFIAQGGTVLLEAAGGAKYQTGGAIGMKLTGFAAAAERLIAEMYGAGKLRRLSLSSGVYIAKGREIRKVAYRGLAKLRLGSREPNLRAVTIGGRVGVLLSHEDITHGLLGCPSYPVDGYEPKSAYAIMRNIVLAAGGK